METAQLIKIETQWVGGSRAALIAVLANGERVRWVGASFAQVEAFYAGAV